MRKHVSSGSPFEDQIGFSRAVRVGPMVAISGTAPIDGDGEVYGEGDAYAQTRRCLELIVEAASQAGMGRAEVIRTRIMLTDISNWEAAARAHREVFSDVAPACTFVQVSRFIDERWLVEVEADCVDDKHASMTAEKNPIYNSKTNA
ncbi:MAG: RidA family protein [Pseudomonadota bacterium]